MKRNLKNLDKESLVADFIELNNSKWDELLCTEKMDPHHSFDMFDKKN